MNQINLGKKAGIDTKQVQFWEMREGEKPTFAGTEEGPQTRVQFKNGKEAILRGDAKAAFDAWAAGDRKREGAKPERQRGGQLYECDFCAWVQCAKGGPTHPDGVGDECVCSSWESRSGAYSGCYEEAEQLRREYLRNGAWPKPEQPEEAKVLLLSRIWKCSKCGEWLATDWKGDGYDLAGPPWSEMIIKGEVKIRLDDVPLVICPKCETANEWPKELRERINA